MLLPVLSPDASLADHNRTGGTWTEDSSRLIEVVTEYWHHNPWVCTTPPIIDFDPSTGLPVEGDCLWPGALSPTGYWGNNPATLSSASRGERVVTRCTRGFNQAADCGHNPYSSQWTFAGSGHSIHLDDRAIATGYVCSAAAGDGDLYQASFGLLYDSDGHPVGHNGPG